MRLALALAVMGLLGQAPQVKVDPDLGVSDTLAASRSARTTTLRYDPAFTIPAAKSQAVSGRELIRFPAASVDEPIVLDYAPDRAGFLTRSEANGLAVAV